MGGETWGYLANLWHPEKIPKQPLQNLMFFFSRWWQLIFFIFTPIPGEMVQFDEHIFQMGWVETTN